MSTFLPRSFSVFRAAALKLTVTLVLVSCTSKLSAQDFIHWQFNLDDAKRQAADSDKLVLVHFAATWCAPCKELDRFVFANPQTVRVVSKDVVPVYIDVDKRPEVADKFGIENIPSDVIITPAGHIIANRASPRSNDGYIAMIQNAIQRDATLSVDAANRIDELRNASQQDGQRKSLNKDSMEFQVDNWHSRIDHTKTVNGGAFVPSRPETPSVNQTTEWQAPKTFKRDSISHIRSTDLDASTNRVASGNENQMLRPKMGAQTSEQAAPTRIVNRFTQQGSSGSTQPSASTDAAMPLLPANPPVNMDNDGNHDSGNHVANNNVSSDYIDDDKITSDVPKNDVDSIAKSPTPDGLPPAGLEGYCPVSLINEGKWTLGDRQWGCIHRGRLYLFTSKENRDQFRMTPDMFSPLLGGADPVVYQESGQLEDGKRELGVFYGEDTGPQVIVLFSNKENHAKFKAEPAKYLGAVRQAMSRLDRGTKLR